MGQYEELAGVETRFSPCTVQVVSIPATLIRSMTSNLEFVTCSHLLKIFKVGALLERITPLSHIKHPSPSCKVSPDPRHLLYWAF